MASSAAAVRRRARAPGGTPALPSWPRPWPPCSVAAPAGGERAPARTLPANRSRASGHGGSWFFAQDHVVDEPGVADACGYGQEGTAVRRERGPQRPEGIRVTDVHVVHGLCDRAERLLHGQPQGF